MIWSTTCGRYTIYAIEDGWFFLNPAEQFPDADPDVWRSHPDALTDGQLRSSIGCFVIAGGKSPIMVDTGIGALITSLPGSQAVGGQLPQALAMVGVRPEDVRTVVHTHLHLDHCGGNRTSSGAALFPNATYRVHPAEIEFWEQEQEHPAADTIRQAIDQFSDGGGFEGIEDGGELAPGVVAHATPGHTLGHLSVSIASQGARAYITGDLTHHPLQATHLDWSAAGDHDPQQARRTRSKVFAELAGTGTIIAASHYPPPGMGYIEATGGTYVYATGTVIQVA